MGNQDIPPHVAMLARQSERGPNMAPVIELLRPVDRVILVYPHALTQAQATQIKDQWTAVAPELRQPLIVAGVSLLVQRGPEVGIESGERGDPEVLIVRVPLDPALIATRPEGLVDRLLDDIRVGIEGAMERWPE